VQPVAWGEIVLALALAAVSPAGATPGWLPPHDVTTTPGVVTSPSVATDAWGSAFAVWAGDQAVLSAARPAAAGAWESPATLSGPGGTAPRIAVTPAGTAIAVWLLSGLVQAAVRPPGAAWGPAETISSPLDSSQSPQISVDAAGDAFAVWGRARGEEKSIQASIRPVETGFWGPPEDVTIPPASDYQPKLAVSARGDAIVVWTLPGGSLRSSFRSADTQAWEPPQTISEGGDITSSGYASVGLDGEGNAVVVCERREGFNAGVVGSRRPISTGEWEVWTPIGGGSNQISQGGPTHRWPRIALDAAGNAIVVWQRTTQPPPPPPALVLDGGLE